MVEDTYGNQHHHNSTVADRWMEREHLYLASNKVRSVNDVDELLHYFLKVNPLTGQPSIIWDPSCKGVLSNFGALPVPRLNQEGDYDRTVGQTLAYRWKQDREGQVYGETPDDKHNHGIKAVEYLLWDRFRHIRPSTNRNAVAVRHTGKSVSYGRSTPRPGWSDILSRR